jgi:hypothetical protein
VKETCKEKKGRDKRELHHTYSVQPDVSRDLLRILSWEATPCHHQNFCVEAQIEMSGHIHEVAGNRTARDLKAKSESHKRTDQATVERDCKFYHYSQRRLKIPPEGGPACGVRRFLMSNGDRTLIG